MFRVEAFRATVTKAVETFQRFGIRFHLTGGIASVYYGEPRMTQDIDIVIDNAQTAKSLLAFLETLDASDFIFNPDSVRAAIAQRSMFQLLDGVEALKLDIYPRELVPGELDRSVPQEVFEGQLLPMASRADVTIAKLIWVSKGSHKSRRDLRQIVMQAEANERECIDQMAGQLGLTKLLHEVLVESDEIL